VSRRHDGAGTANGTGGRVESEAGNWTGGVPVPGDSTAIKRILQGCPLHFPSVSTNRSYTPRGYVTGG
jgi:hypothetical protein